MLTICYVICDHYLRFLSQILSYQWFIFLSPLADQYNGCYATSHSNKKPYRIEQTPPGTITLIG